MLVKTTKPIKKAIKAAIDSSKNKKIKVDIEYPKNQADYHNRLIIQKKEIYKNPCDLPPNYPHLVEIDEERQSLPKRS